METIVKKYYIITYGCQMNIHESEKIAGILSSIGYIECQSENDADVIVFNTCCIRENAEDRADGNIGALKKLKKNKKELIIAVGGCMTQQSGYAQKLHQKFPFIDIIFGTHNLEDFKNLLMKKLAQKKTLIEVLQSELPIKEGVPKTRTSYPNAWINITYGCNNFCTYCIVPYVRGRERSRKINDIVEECKSVLDEGYKEITLLGQNVNSYGNDLKEVDFADLITEISKIDKKFRLRFMTNHPKDLSEKLVVALSNSDKVCHSIHLPIQAGSNRILKLMNRKYDRESYFDKVEMLKKYMPNIAITTDIMVGFPTETEQDFLDTIDIVKKVEFAGAFTFIYSKRKGTPAASMDGQVDEIVAKERIMKLIDLQNSINRKQSAQYKDKVVEILCEGYDEKKDMFLGRDEYGRMVYFKGNENDIGQFLNIKIMQTGGISLIGKKIN